MKKKVLIISIIVILLIFITIIGYKLYKNYRIKTAVKIVELNTTEIDVYEDIKLSDLIKKINGTLTNDIKIDTTKIGKKKLTFTYINEDNLKIPYTISFDVVDKAPPIIKSFTVYNVVVGSDSFVDKLFCGDNYDDTPKCYIEGDYDLNTVGEYDLVFVGEDSSSNISKNPFKLIVSTLNQNKEDEYEIVKTPFSEIVKDYKKENTKIGIDVSHWQGDIDFQKVKNSGVEFAYIRVGRGDGIGEDIVLDDKFVQNIIIEKI